MSAAHWRCLELTCACWFPRLRIQKVLAFSLSALAIFLSASRELKWSMVSWWRRAEAHHSLNVFDQSLANSKHFFKRGLEFEEGLSKHSPWVGDRNAFVHLFHEPIDLDIDPIVDSWTTDPAEREPNFLEGIFCRGGLFVHKEMKFDSVEPAARCPSGPIKYRRNGTFELLHWKLPEGKDVEGNGWRKDRYWLALPRAIGFGFQDVVADTGATPTPNEDEVGKNGDLPWWREDKGGEGRAGGGWQSNLKYTETHKGVQEFELHKKCPPSSKGSIYTQAGSHGQAAAAASVHAVTTDLREHNRSRYLLSQIYEWSLEGHEGLHEGEQGTCVLILNSKRTRRRNIAGSCESMKVW
ncbi:hypothetical protein EDB92DRAFT_1811946 [Lactarius akahatsu]|uniref:Uncharacterized protein n=1 Tax=Lactarius akahatsu TaxID=416441 RepID=A0AAD4LSI4_9AGAM|nr:hypothetical protein EDB92DRAFT_1811946 [Lactarius akahatsu]